MLKQHKELEQEKQDLQSKKEEYQKDLERLRDAQRKLERDREAVQRQLDKMEELRLAEVSRHMLKNHNNNDKQCHLLLPAAKLALLLPPRLQGNTHRAGRGAVFHLMTLEYS